MESTLSQNVERRLQEVLLQLTNEITIFERLMYKNVNQHRRALYFRRLCQVRRDLRLLQLVNLKELVQNVLQCLEKNPRKPSLQEGRQQFKGTKCEVLNMRRHLYGVMRLLEQMHDPLLKASSQVADLLGRTFFMPFALTALSLLARIRVLVLQCVHDLMMIFNRFSEWALNKALFDQNFHALPISVSCKWDGLKLFLSDTSTHPQHEKCRENEGYVEDNHGRKYIIDESMVLGTLYDSGVKESMQTRGSIYTAYERPLIEARLPTQYVEKADYKSTEPFNNSAKDIDEKEETNNQQTPTIQDQVPSKEGPPGLPSQSLKPKARDDFLHATKVAYVSVPSTFDSKAEKRDEETPPLKKQKKDSLFDMLLGLGDETHTSLS